MCGIFGYNGSKRPSLDKIKILGLYNKSRGTDSSGLMVGKKVYKRIGGFDLFIENTDIKNKFETNTVIGHTRKSSSGSISLENAHPFSFIFNKKEEFPVAGVHNGTIYNINEIKEKYNVVSELKVDSAILIKALIENPKKVKNILRDYRGNAALLINDTREKNVLWLFKGASKNYASANNTVEERPLYMWTKSENEKYFSSIKDSLQAIGAKKEEIEDLPTNILMKFKNGKIEQEIKVDRKNSFRIQENTYSYSSGYSSHSRHNNCNNNKNNCNIIKKLLDPREDKIKNSVKQNLFNNITKEDRVFMENLRFKIFRYCDVEKKYRSYLLDGSYRLFPDGSFDRGVCINNKIYFNKESRDFFFYRGVMLHEPLSRKNIVKLNKFLEENNNSLKDGWAKTQFFLKFYYYFSEYPFTLYGNELDDQKAYKMAYQPIGNDDYIVSAFQGKTFDQFFDDFLKRIFTKNNSLNFKDKIIYPDVAEYKYNFEIPFARGGKIDFTAGRMNILDEKSRAVFINLEKDLIESKNGLDISGFTYLQEYYKEKNKESENENKELYKKNFAINKVISKLKRCTVLNLLEWDVSEINEEEILFSKDAILDYLNDLKAESGLNYMAEEKHIALCAVLDATFSTVFADETEVYWDSEKMEELYEKYSQGIFNDNKQNDLPFPESKTNEEEEDAYQEFLSETISNFFHEADSFISILEELCQEFPDVLKNEDIKRAYKCLTELTDSQYSIISEIEDFTGFEIDAIIEEDEEYEDAKFI